MDKIKTRKIEFEIEGYEPGYLIDPYLGLDAPKNRDEGIQQGEQKADSRRNEKGEICVPATQLKAVLKLAAGEQAKKTEVNKRKTEIRACLNVFPAMLSTGRKEHDGIDIQPVQRDKGKGIKTIVLTYRPILKKWKVRGEMEFMDNISPEYVKNLLEFGGIRIALGGYRPEYGRFRVTKFKEI